MTSLSSLPHEPPVRFGSDTANLEDRLGEIHCPTLLVWGTEDRVTPRDVAIRFLDGIPSATLRLVPECGHAPMLEHPEAFARAVEELPRPLTPGPM